MQKDWQAVQERELKTLKEENTELVAALRGLLYQTEFHADEYRDELLFSYEQRKVTPGVIARFEGIANDIKKLLNDKKPE